MTSKEELGQEIASLSAHLDAATHRLLECIRQFDEAGGWHDQGAVSCAHWLAWRVGLDPATAREKVRVARALGTLPAIDEAFRSARLSYAKVRALTRVATPQNEQSLLEMALIATGAQLERLCRGYRAVTAEEAGPTPEERSVRRRLLPGGMVKLELVLEPDEADLVLRAVERARAEEAPKEPAEPAADVSAETSWPPRADGAVRLAESFLAGHPVSGTGGERFQVMVHLDQEPLGADGEWAGTLEDGTRVSAETLRRVACDCGLLTVGRDGENLNIGRRARSIPPAIRRALMRRDRGCAFPGCSHTRFLHGHHIQHWLHGGETRLGNLAHALHVPPSPRPRGGLDHHRERGWRIPLPPACRQAAGSAAAIEAGGAVAAPGVDNSLAWLREWADERNLDLGPEVNMPLWDGAKPDYKLAVSGLLEAG